MQILNWWSQVRFIQFKASFTPLPSSFTTQRCEHASRLTWQVIGFAAAGLDAPITPTASAMAAGSKMDIRIGVLLSDRVLALVSAGAAQHT
jgi:hypothetical protein